MEESKNFETIKVSSKSEPNKVAGLITLKFKDEEAKEIKIRVIGAGALNQAMKAIITARSFLIQSGIEINLNPGFYSTIIDEKEITGIELRITRK